MTTHRIKLSICFTLLFSCLGCAEDVLRSLRTNTDEFSQSAASKIDVLWVIDNSDSMQYSQQAIGTNFPTFINTLVSSGVDYHIGVVTTDTSDLGRLEYGSSNIAVVTSQTTNAESAFIENVNVGIGGSAQEKAFETAALALGKGLDWNPTQNATPPNTDFLRDEAALFIIMVSDENDKSFGPVGYYKRLFESYKGAGNEALISVSAIVGPEPDGCYSGSVSAQPGGRYAELALETNGVVTSICDDFNTSLAELSLTATGLNSIFKLSDIPNTSGIVECAPLSTQTFCVKVNGEALAEGNNLTGWQYDRTQNAVVFGVNNIPHPQAKITVEYMVASK